MPVPTRAEAAAIAKTLAPPEWLLQHSTAVGEIAAFLCTAMVARGVSVDGTLAVSAAFLHDVDKMLAADHTLKPLGHARAGAEWMRRNGYPELAAAVEHHPVMELGLAPSYEAWAGSAGLEGRVVAYADKRAKMDVVSLTERFAEWHDRFPNSPALFLAQERADVLEREMCELAGIEAADVRREAWVAEALNAAA